MRKAKEDAEASNRDVFSTTEGIKAEHVREIEQLRGQLNDAEFRVGSSFEESIHNMYVKALRF